MSDKTKKRLIFSAGVRALLVLFGILGQFITTTEFMGGAQLLYYTNMSNIWITAIAAVMLIYDIRRIFCGGSPAPRWLQTINFVFTVAILLTFIVFSLLLIPQMIMLGLVGYLTSINNLIVHNIVPLLALLSWCISGGEFELRKGSWLFGLIMPLAYCVFALVGSALGLTFGGDNKVPYFFFDYEVLGWFGFSNGIGVAWWIVILSGVIAFISFALIAIAKARAKKMQ